MKKLIALLSVILLSGCMTATTSMSSGLDTKTQGEQKVKTATSQETSNTNNTESGITTVESLDETGKVITRTTTIIAKTGSESSQEANVLNDLKQKFEMKTKLDQEASAKADINFAYMIWGIAAMILIYLLISGGSRVLGVINKVRKIPT